MTPLCYLSSILHPNTKIWPHLHRCNSVRIHPYAHPQHTKVLKHFIYIQYGCKIQSELVYSLMTWQPAFGPTSHMHRCTNVRVHPLAHPKHIKVLNPSYIAYGCEKQSGLVYSLKTWDYVIWVGRSIRWDNFFVSICACVHNCMWNALHLTLTWYCMNAWNEKVI